MPHGRTDNGGRNDRGAWRDAPAGAASRRGPSLTPGYDAIVAKHPQARPRRRTSSTSARSARATTSSRSASTRRTASGSCCTAGSRGVGNRIGSYFIELAKEDMRRWFVNLPDEDLAYLPEGTEHFDDYVEAVELGAGLRAHQPRADDGTRWSRRCARRGELPAFEARRRGGELPPQLRGARAPLRRRTCFVTRKGAVRARAGRPRHHPGQHGRALVHRARQRATRRASTAAATARAARCRATRRRRRFTLEDHAAATAGIECRKDADVIDETPAAYKSIDAGDGGAARPGRGRAHAAAGRVREGVRATESMIAHRWIAGRRRRADPAHRRSRSRW